MQSTMPRAPEPSSPKSPFARNHLIRDAISRAIGERMAVDESIYLFGEGCEVKHHYDAPETLARWPDRIITLPISEDGNVNYAVGSMLVGVKPVVDVISSDFLYRCMDSIANTAAKHNFVSGQEDTMVIRTEFLTGGPTTGQRPEALFAHIPGLRVVIPSTPHDAYCLMQSALITPGVTIFGEDRMISDDGSWMERDLRFNGVEPIGEGYWRIMGLRGQVTIVTYGLMRQRTEKVLREWREQELRDFYGDSHPDLIDLRSIYPIDWTLIKKALERTGKLLIIEPDIQYGGVGAEIAATIAEEMPYVKVKRLGAPYETVPAALARQDRMLPSEAEIASAIRTFIQQ